MSIEIHNNGIKDKYNKEEYLNKFIPLVLKHCPKFSEFSVLDLHKNLNLSENEINIFKDLAFDIRVYLIENNYAILKGSSNIKIIENKELNIVAENYIAGNNYGTQSSNNFSNNPTTNNTIANPKSELNTNSLILKFWKLISENKLISSLVLAVILYIIKDKFNIEL